MRRSSVFLTVLAAGIALFALMFVHASVRRRADAPALAAEAAFVRTLGITDVCLFTEASYTRHVTQADLHTPFMEGPSALEHFPSGALMPPPRSLRRLNEKGH